MSPNSTSVIAALKSPAPRATREITGDGGAADRPRTRGRAEHEPTTTTRSSRMASLTVPPVPKWPRQDAIDLHRAFKGRRRRL